LGNKIISIEPISGLTRGIYGVTVDIGTSCEVLYLNIKNTTISLLI